MSADNEERLHIGGMRARDAALMKQLVKEGTSEALDEFAIKFGIDPKDPLRWQRNMQFLDKTRERSEGLFGKAILGAITIAVAGAMHTMWVGAKDLLH